MVREARVRSCCGEGVEYQTSVHVGEEAAMRFQIRLGTQEAGEGSKSEGVLW